MASAPELTSYPYEVYCNRCRVSMPVGTRRCVHCGGAPSSQRSAGAEPRTVQEPGSPALPAPEEFELDLPGAARGRPGFSGSSLVWLLIVVAFSVYRACTR